MRTGHCRHDWVLRSEALRAAFPAHAGLAREFRVCARCLRVEELAAQAVAVGFPARSDPPAPKEGGADEQAA